MGYGRALFINVWHFLASLKGRCGAFIHFEETQEELTRLRRESRVDELTQMPNSRAFKEITSRLFATIARDNYMAIRQEKPIKAIAILAIDIDNFKTANDEYGGHDSGNRVLVNIAGTLRRTLHRGSDLCARLHGDEFVAMICDDYNRIAKSAETIAENLRQAIEEGCALNVDGRVGTSSIGVAIIIPTADDEGYVAAALRRADDAAYAAKNAGRNCVHIMDSDGKIYSSSLNPRGPAIFQTRTEPGNQAQIPVEPSPRG